MNGRSPCQLWFLLLAGLLLWAAGCQAGAPDDEPAGLTVQGPALLVYYADN